jgi:hypothetical protein
MSSHTISLALVPINGASSSPAAGLVPTVVAPAAHAAVIATAKQVKVVIPEVQYAIVKVSIHTDLLNLIGDVLALPERILKSNSALKDFDANGQSEYPYDPAWDLVDAEPVVALVDACALFAKESQSRLLVKPYVVVMNKNSGMVAAPASIPEPPVMLLRPVSALCRRPTYYLRTGQEGLERHWGARRTDGQMGHRPHIDQANRAQEEKGAIGRFAGW